jgi:hypothetical protein
MKPRGRLCHDCGSPYEGEPTCWWPHPWRDWPPCVERQLAAEVDRRERRQLRRAVAIAAAVAAIVGVLAVWMR